MKHINGLSGKNETQENEFVPLRMFHETIQIGRQLIALRQNDRMETVQQYKSGKESSC